MILTDTGGMDVGEATDQQVQPLGVLCHLSIGSGTKEWESSHVVSKFSQLPCPGWVFILQALTSGPFDNSAYDMASKLSIMLCPATTTRLTELNHIPNVAWSPQGQ